MSTPKVSIIIPTYKQVTYLRKLLDSVQGQLFTDYEVIIHDDSPSDTVQKLIAEYPLDGKLHYFHNQPALGSPKNWNMAIRRARGEYIKVMMHDDWFIDETCLGKFIQMLDDKPEANFGIAVQKVWNVQSNHTLNYRLTPEQQKKMARFPEWLFFRNRAGVPSATIFRRQLNQFYDLKLKYIVDLEFNLRAIKRQHSFAYHPEPLVCVTTGLDFQTTNDCYGNKSVELFEHAHLFSKIYDKKFDPRFFVYWMKIFLKFHVDKDDPEYQKICRTYPALSSYMGLVVRGTALVQSAARIPFMRDNFLGWLLPQGIEARTEAQTE